MKKFIFLFLGFLFSTNQALAESTCTLNGETIPCENLFDKTTFLLGLGGSIFFIIIAFAILSIFCLIFWILMLVHSLKYDVPNKVLWIIALVVFGFLAAVFYYFIVKRPFDKKELVRVEKIKD